MEARSDSLARLGWQEAAAILGRAVRTEVDRLLGIEIASLMNSRLALSFFPAFAGGRHAPGRTRNELLALFQRLASQPASRSALAGSLAATRSDLIEKYISRAWTRKKCIYGEVRRVRRLALPPAEIGDLLRFALMIRPAAYLYMTIGAAPEKNAGFTPLAVRIAWIVRLSYRSHFLPGDYSYYAAQGVEVFLDERPIAGAAAREAIVWDREGAGRQGEGSALRIDEIRNLVDKG